MKIIMRIFEARFRLIREGGEIKGGEGGRKRRKRRRRRKKRSRRGENG